MMEKFSKHTPDQIVRRLENVIQKCGVDVCRAQILAWAGFQRMQQFVVWSKN